MRNTITLILLLFLSIGCSKDDFFYGSQEDLTGVWIQESIKLDDYRVVKESCEEITIDDNGNSSWTDCDGNIDTNIMLEGLEENVNFSIEEIEDVPSRYYLGKFISKNKIEIRKFVKFNYNNSTSKYTYIFKKQ